jgi:hypothetical protein
MQTITRSRYAVVADNGTVVDGRRRRLRPPRGSRLREAGASVEAEPLRDPAPGSEYAGYSRAIITAVQPPPLPGRPWLAEFETADADGVIRLDGLACEVLEIPEPGTLALEREFYVVIREGEPVRPRPIPVDDESPRGGAPLLSLSNWDVQPTDPCMCLSGLAYGACHGVPRPTVAVGQP